MGRVLWFLYIFIISATLEANTCDSLFGAEKFFIQATNKLDVASWKILFEGMSKESFLSRYPGQKVEGVLRYYSTSKTSRRIFTIYERDDVKGRVPVGMAEMAWDNNAPPSVAILVLDAYQGQRLGSQLSEALRDFAFEQGFSEIHATVTHKNADANSASQRLFRERFCRGGKMIQRYGGDEILLICKFGSL